MAEIRNSGFENIFYIDENLCTRNLSPGESVYGEFLYKIDSDEYRYWNPRRSKLAAMILNGCKTVPITPDTNVLYLGAGTGTTASHVAEIATKGKIYCIEFSARAFRDLLTVASRRNNMLPILESAFYPERYKPLVEKIDVIYQDISQREQTRAFIKNAKLFLKPNGQGIYMIKARSIDMTKPPADIFKNELSQLKLAGFRILEQIQLEPYTKDHLGVIVQFK